MKAFHSLLVLALTLASSAGTAWADDGKKPVESYKQIQYPPLNKINAPAPERYTLENGLTVYLVEDHQLPMINASAMIRAGSRWEPSDKTGLADIVGSTIRTGGTVKNPGDKLDEQLDRMGASIETGLGEDAGSASLSVLKEDAELGMNILADLLQNPAFPEEKIELEKIALRDGIARRNDTPSSIPGREFRRLLRGKDSPYGRQAEYKTVNSITKDDCVQFHGRYFQPENIILGAWGDFDKAAMKALIQKAFGSWTKGGKSRPEIPSIDAEAAKTSGLFFIAKDDVNQSWIRMGHLGGLYSDPDYYSLEVMDSILGGGFASRLFSKVRSDMGLAYTVGSAWAPGWDHPGMFLAYGSTKSESTVAFIEAIKTEIVKMTEAEVAETELQRAKDNILKGFAFEFDSVGKIIGRLMLYEYYGYPGDYLQKYQENIAKVTVKDVLRVAKQYLKPDRFAILVLGDAKKFDQPLSKLGKVTEIDITIPKE